MLRPFFIHFNFEAESLLLFFDKFLQVGSLDVHAKLDLFIEKLMALILWSKLQLFKAREKRLFNLEKSWTSVNLANQIELFCNVKEVVLVDIAVQHEGTALFSNKVNTFNFLSTKALDLLQHGDVQSLKKNLLQLVRDSNNLRCPIFIDDLDLFDVFL